MCRTLAPNPLPSLPCHPHPAPDEFLYRYVAGIQQAPGSVGWATVRIAPKLPTGLDWVKAAFDSPRGLVTSAWRVLPAAGGVELTVAAPPGADLEVVLPRSGRQLRLHGGVEHVLLDN